MSKSIPAVSVQYAQIRQFDQSQCLGRVYERRGEPYLLIKSPLALSKFVMEVRELDIDLIDHITPFSEAYAILAKT